MKELFYDVRLVLVAGISLFLTGCLKDNITKTYTILTPVYESKATVLSNIRSDQPQALRNPGKVFIKDKYLFINELDRGVHIYNNSNPANPEPITFIAIPGNVDLAVKGNTLYADMYSDLVVIDITDPLHATFKKNIPGIFPGRHNMASDAEFLIVDWTAKDTVMQVDAVNNGTWGGCAWCYAVADNAAAMAKSGTYVPGLAGSMARFSIVNDFLYTVNNTSLTAFNIQDTEAPVKHEPLTVGWNIETIYPFKDKLFIGSSTGMFIYNISNPAVPVQEGTFTHARACDPVIADDNYAFVTLRTGNNCGGVINELVVVDVSNVMSPFTVNEYRLANPAGLAKDDNLLFICDGKEGLKIFDASDVTALRLIEQFGGMDAYDAIAWNNNLITVAKDGIYQYDYSDPNNIRQSSFIRTVKPN